MKRTAASVILASQWLMVLVGISCGEKKPELMKILETQRMNSGFNKNLPDMVMVSSDSHALVGYELKAHPSYVQTIVDEQGEGSLLLRLESPEQWAEIAAFAHSEKMCGALQAVDLRLMGGPLRLDEAQNAQPMALIDPLEQISELDQVLAEVTRSRIESDVQGFVDLNTRHAQSPSGKQVPQILKDQVEAILSNYEGASAAHFEHQFTEQNSLIVRLPGQGPGAEEMIVVGAHLDSICVSGCSAPAKSQPAPGADDDASGMATLIEVLRVIAHFNLQFDRDIEFHFYAAEELGLVGSQEIAKHYRDQEKKVHAMLQVDMNAYSQDPGSKTIYLATNDTNRLLRRALMDLLDTYLDGDYQEGRIIGGTSDHRSWALQGYPAVFPFEHPSRYNPMIHTPNDTMVNANNFELSERFGRLVVAFLSHYAGLSSISGQNISSASPTVGNDLYLAIIAANHSENSPHLIVSAPQATSYAYLCLTESSSPWQCSNEGTLLEPIESPIAQRSGFAITFPYSFEQSTEVLIQAYDQDQRMLARRSLRLRK